MGRWRYRYWLTRYVKAVGQAKLVDMRKPGGYDAARQVIIPNVAKTLDAMTSGATPGVPQTGNAFTRYLGYGQEGVPPQEFPPIPVGGGGGGGASVSVPGAGQSPADILNAAAIAQRAAAGGAPQQFPQGQPAPPQVSVGQGGVPPQFPQGQPAPNEVARALQIKAALQQRLGRIPTPQEMADELLRNGIVPLD